MVDPATDRGRRAASPAEIPARGWRDVLSRTAHGIKRDQVSLLAAGVAFYFFLALVPLLVVAVAVYSIVAGPDDVQRFANGALGAAPLEVRHLVTRQLRSLTRTGSQRAGVAAVLAGLVALWSAASGTGHLIDAINTAFGEGEGRSFVRRKALAIGMTVAGLVGGVIAVVLIAFVPSLAADGFASGTVRWVIGIVRWPLLALAMLGALNVMYRLTPDRRNAKWRWVTPGAGVAVGLWIAGSLLFSLYAANFGRYQAIYGSLASIVVLLLWLLLTAFAIIAGAELDAELERQTGRDSTTGTQERPIGTRGAYAADTVGPTAHELKDARKADRS